MDRVVSTMDEARALPSQPLPAVVVARSQTGGRGRFDRTWISPPRGGIYLTTRIPWTRPIQEAPLVTLGTAVALARLCAELRCPGISLKWPNDLLLQGRKAAGILAEMFHPADAPPQLLVGVGINVDLPPEEVERIGQPATSLRRSCGTVLDPEQVLGRFLSIWEDVDRLLERSGFPALAPEYRAWSDLEGRTFLLDGAGPEAEIVRTLSIRDDGALEVEVVPGGERRVVHGGELRPLPPPPR